jgi:hypothetical protein
MSNKLALVWDAERAGREIDAVWEKREAVERKRADFDDTLLKLLLEAKANYGGPFKEFVETYTHISLTTAKRTLRIADGRGEEVRQQERERQQRSRAAKGVTVTPAEGVELAASQGVTMPEPQVAEWLRLAKMPEVEFEAHVAAETKRIAPPAEGETVADAELAAFEFSYNSKEQYEEISKRAASVGVKLPPMKDKRGWRTARVYVPIGKADEFDDVIGGHANRLPVWAAKARDRRKPYDTGTALQFINDAASTLKDVEDWQDMLDRNDEYAEPDRFVIDDNVVAGAKAAAEAWAKLYETILRQARATS